MNKSDYSFTYRYETPKPKPKTSWLSMTLLLIIINVIFFIIVLALQAVYGDQFLTNIALQPLAILHGEKLWTIVTSMFMHGSIWHLAINMLSLMFLGSFLERIIGKKKFIVSYIIFGIVASLFFVFLALAFNQDLSISAVGASGAIFGIGGLLAVLTPRVPVYMMFIPIAMPMWLGIVLSLAVMWLVSAAARLPIGNTAHLGGFVSGLAYGFYLRFRYKKKVAQLDKVFR